MKILILIATIAVVVGVASYFYFTDQVEHIEQKYSGPVQEGYDEQYFRETGITRPLQEGIVIGSASS